MKRTEYFVKSESPFQRLQQLCQQLQSTLEMYNNVWHMNWFNYLQEKSRLVNSIVAVIVNFILGRIVGHAKRTFLF